MGRLEKLILALILVAIIMFGAAPLVRWAFSVQTDLDGNRRVRTLDADFMEPPKFNGIPNGQSLWINIAPGCGMLMKRDAGGVSCLDSVCPVECIEE